GLSPNCCCALAGARVLAADKLFATLDPTTRQVTLPNHQKLLLTDTVGFIAKLPHTVIESFKATLEEVQLADLLIHVVDLSHPQFHQQMEAVDAALAELDANGKQTIIVFNKIDLVPDPQIIANQLARHPGSVGISARSGEGLSSLIEELEIRLSVWRLRGEFRIPTHESALLAEIHRTGHVLEIRYEGEFAILHAHVPPELSTRLAAYESRRA
ncbi:MAG: HflX GTPase family protein, partial [Terrimicrobiaceae bacterium]